MAYVRWAYVGVNLSGLENAGLDSRSDVLHPAHMATDTGHPGHYFRQWRKAAGLTLEQAADRIAFVSEARADAALSVRPLSMTHATLSRIERGKLPYSQGLLEVLAEVYRTDRASLIMRDPSDPEGLWSLWEGLKPGERAQAVAVLKALQDARNAA